MLFTFLNLNDQSIVDSVLRDFKLFVDGDWAVVGSLSYRLFLPPNLRSDRLGDIDIAVFARPGDKPTNLINPRVKDNFLVSHIYGDIDSGYYFGLVHKDTRTWIDVYTYARVPSLVVIKSGENMVNIQAIEETLFALIKDLLWRSRDNKLIKPKWLKTARLLWDNVDHQKVTELMKAHLEEFTSLAPPELGSDTLKVINYVLEEVQIYTTPEPPANPPDDCVKTANGITIDTVAS